MKTINDSFFYCIKLSEKNNLIEIMRVGSWNHPSYGKLEITEASLNDFVRNFDEKVRGIDIAFDLEHGETQHKGASVAWVKSLKKEGTSLFAEVELTELGKQKLASGEYRYFSPEFKFSYSDAETGNTYSNVLLGGSFTNRPFIKNMQPVLLSEDVILEAHQDSTRFIYRTENKEEYKLNKKLLGILKLDENATEDQVSEAINKVVENNENLTKEVETKTTDLEAKTKEVETKTTENVALSETIKTLTNSKTDLEKDNIKLSERIGTIETKLVETEWNQLAAQKLSEGILTPAMAEKFKASYMKDKETTLALMETLQPVVKLGEMGNSKGQGEISNVKLFDEKVKQIMTENKINYIEALVLAEKLEPVLFAEMNKERGVK